MKDETITGSTDSNGLFRAENPYVNFDYPNAVLGSKAYSNNKIRVEFAEAHPPLFCYNENNQLIKGVEGLEVKPWFAVSAVKDQTPRLLTDQEMNKYHSFEEFKKHKCMLFTYEVYIPVQPTEKAEKQSTGEKELYYCLSDNGDLNGLYLASMREVSEHIEMDLGDIEPSDLEKVQYTITPVFMTQEEFDNLPEYEG